MLSGDQMRHFVSAQTYALRHFAATRTGADRFGFAWAPNNATAIPRNAFVAETGHLLDRLGAAISASGSEWIFDPGIHACASLGLDWCRADVEGAEFTDAWRIFSAWSQPLRLVPGVNKRLAKRVEAVTARVRREAGFFLLPRGT
jgi:hypothetical protein